MINRSNMNKRGTILPFYFVLLVLAMIGMVWGAYAYHQGVLEASLVSPLPVVEVVDGVKIFEMRELELIRDVSQEIDFDSQGFEYMFLVKFLDRMDGEMKEFVSRGLVVDEKAVSNESLDSFFRNYLYVVGVEGDRLVLDRRDVGKKMELAASDKSAVNFPVDVVFDFSGVKYLVGRDGSVKKLG